MFSALWTSIRPHQWLKNLFVFVPLVFAKEFLNLESVQLVTLAFIAFCLISSGTYLFNDLVDRAADRLHPLKRQRPIASGKLPAEVAMLIATLLILSALALTTWLNPKVAEVLLAYLVLQGFYSLLLKHFVIIDILTIAISFVLRVLAGAFAIAVPASGWLLLITLLLALLLAAGKRRREIETSGRAARKVLNQYSPELLDSFIKIILPALLVSYLFYSFQASQSIYFFFTVPIVIYGLFRYLLLLESKTAAEGPTELLLEDRPLLISVALWLTMVILILVYG